MLTEGEPIADRVTAAAARTVAAATARLFSAWREGSPVPEEQDRRCEGVADLAGRRARVSQALLFSERVTAELAERADLGQFREPVDMIYDGANAYLRVAGRWTGFFLGNPDGPRGPNDPIWPLDALFGANGDAVEVGPEAVRGEPATRFRCTVDLARADAALPPGVSVPAGPYRALRRMPAEVWLDAGGLARRVAVSTDPLSTTGDAQNWAIVELWDFGVVADITPPSPDEVMAPHNAFRDTPGPTA